MNVRSILLASALVSLGLVVPSTSALDFCANSVVVPINTGGNTYYSIVDQTYLYPAKGVLYSVWVYEETNGIDGIQRNPEQGDPCGVYPGPWDTVIF